MEKSSMMGKENPSNQGEAVEGIRQQTV